MIGQEEKLDAFKNRKITLKTGDGSEKQAEVTWNAVKTVNSDAVGLGRFEADIKLEDGSKDKRKHPGKLVPEENSVFRGLPESGFRICQGL